MREKIAETIRQGVLYGFTGILDSLTVDKIADQILSLPSGLVAGEHELTVQEALEDYQRIIFNFPEYPDVGYFDGERITKPIIPQSR
jgi:hypothetical protein